MRPEPAPPSVTLQSDGITRTWQGQQTEGLRLKYMAPGHFCPDVVDLSDFGEADYLRGKFIRGIMRLMEFWPKPRGSRRWRRNRS